jgi:hypothetical protein
MASTSAPAYREPRDLQLQLNHSDEFEFAPAWGEGAASALRMLRSLEQRRQLSQPAE